MIYQVKVQLKHVRPPIWRRLQVPREMTFAELHQVLQLAFDWADMHLHTFYVTKTRGMAKVRIEIGNEQDSGNRWAAADYNEHTERLGDWLVNEGDRCLYIYDFGDNWEHEIVLEKVVQPEEGVSYPLCVKAMRVAPEEDGWGEEWDPEEVGEKELTALINEKLQPLRKDTLLLEDNVWKVLLEKAKAFNQLQLWQWMDDDEIFLIVDPESGKKLFCSVIGALGEEFGMVVYIGNDGYKSLRQTFENPAYSSDRVYSQHALLISFANRNELEKEDYKLIQSQGMTFRGKKQWPQFRSFVPGYYPWTISEEEAKLAIVALDQAIDVVQRVERGLFIPPFLSNGAMFARIGEKRGNIVTWRDEMISTDELEIKEEETTYELLVDPKLIDMAKMIDKKYNAPIEFEASHVNKPIQEKKGERPYFPIFVLAVDLKTGLVIHQDLLPLNDMAMRVQKSFLDMILSLGKVPREVRMKRTTKAMLEPVLSQLPIRVLEVSQVPVVDHVRRLFERF
jgi:hypothetical protein